MNASISCVDAGRLRELLALDGDSPYRQALETHLQQCDRCRRLLLNISAEAMRGAALTADHMGGNTLEKPTVNRHTSERLKELDFLDPPENPAHLGRLAHYELIAVLGRGGMGTVFKAYDKALQRAVALKLMSPELAASDTSRQRFIREARAAAAVTHEHVVTIHAVDEDWRVPYLVMQFIEGRSLQDHLAKGPLPIDDILRISREIALGLAAAHEKGLVHRDIKPANILLEAPGNRVKITDFGLARAVDDASLTQSGAVIGTPLYMAPEQARGESLDHRADLFSLGVVMYALCTGESPFRAGNSIAVLRRVCEDDPTPIRGINPNVPEWLETIIVKLLAKNPNQRFPTARSVVESLEHRVPARGSQMAVQPVNLAPSKALRSRRLLLVGGITLLLLVGVGIILLNNHNEKERIKAAKEDEARNAAKQKLLEEKTPPVIYNVNMPGITDMFKMLPFQMGSGFMPKGEYSGGEPVNPFDFVKNPYVDPSPKTTSKADPKGTPMINPFDLINPGKLPIPVPNFPKEFFPPETPP